MTVPRKVLISTVFVPDLMMSILLCQVVMHSVWFVGFSCTFIETFPKPDSGKSGIYQLGSSYSSKQDVIPMGCW